ncbi:hypothetical protein V8F20_004586 [Naviculisporaceae sp. PSN 640]
MGTTSVWSLYPPIAYGVTAAAITPVSFDSLLIVQCMCSGVKTRNYPIFCLTMASCLLLLLTRQSGKPYRYG